MDKINELRVYTLLIIAVFLLTTSCDDNGDDNGPDQNPDPVSLDVEIVRGSVEDIDGNIYETVVIGGQEWMAENLRTTTFRNSTPIVFPGDNNNAWTTNNTGAYAWVNNLESNKEIFGALYNYYTVTNTAGLCPAGWRIPSNTDWTNLLDFLGAEYSLSNAKEAVGGIGNRLKSCRQIRSQMGSACATSTHPRWHNHDTHYGFDDFGFAALPTGSRGVDGSYFENTGFFGQFWSTTSNGAEEAFHYYITYDNGSLFRGSSPKAAGHAVRCVR
jgi:uncharacterized protein (TIGR02145 family)